MTFGFHGLIKSKKFSLFICGYQMLLIGSRDGLGGLVVYGDVSSGTWSSFIQIEIKGPTSLIHISGSIFCLYKGFRIEVIQITSLEV